MCIRDRNWTEAKERHFERTINSSFRQAQRLNAETMYYEAIRKERIDSGQIAFYQVAIIDIQLGLLNSYYSKQQNSKEEYDKFSKNKKRILNEIQQHLNNSNYNKINNYYNEVETVFRNNFESLKRKHQSFLNNIIKKESKWNNIFIWLYSIGSLLIGIGYLKNIINTNN